MAKLLLRAGYWLHAGVVLAMAAFPVCMTPAVYGQIPVPAPGLYSWLASGSHKKPAIPEPPPVRSTVPPTQAVPVDQLGFAAPGQFYLGTRSSMVSLDFLDENRLLFTFRVPGLIHRDFSSSEPGQERQIRAVVLHLPDGAVQAQALWTVHDRAPYLFMLDNGQFLVRDKEVLQLGDASLQLKPLLKFPGPVLWVEEDPSRQYLVTGSREPRAEKPKEGEVLRPATAAADVVGDEEPAKEKPDMVLRILRRDTGKVMLVSRVRSAVHLPINSEGYLEALRGKGHAWVLNMNYFTGGSRVLGNVDSVCSPALNFVSPKEFLVTACSPSGDPRLMAMSTNGHRLWDEPATGPSVWPVLVMAPNGSRLVRETLISDHEMNAYSPLSTDDIKGQDVAVFDAANGKIALRAMANPVFDAGGNVAISPSSRRVAVLMTGGIQIFDLPAPPPVPDGAENKAER